MADIRSLKCQQQFFFLISVSELILPLLPYHLLNVPSGMPFHTDGVIVAQTRL